MNKRYEEKMQDYIKNDLESLLDEYLLGYLDEYRDELKDVIEALHDTNNLDRFFSYLDDKARIANIHSYLDRDTEAEDECFDEDKAQYRVVELKDLCKNNFKYQF